MSMYDVDKYTDQELMNILDLFNPTDRELEMKIIHYIRKYDLIQNTEGDRLADFYRDIYRRFFDVIESEDGGDRENMVEEEDLVEEDFVEEDVVEGFETEGIKKKDPSPSLSDPIKIEKEDPKQTKEVSEKNVKVPEVQLTSTFHYTKGKINPLLKETVKRIITIDSQYRDARNSLSTDFTLNFNEILKDVVSLKLYAIQIPYNWYTISQNYGSNFLYIKGVSSGINTGNHDYKIAISPGNYNQTTLTTAIQSSIAGLSALYTDVSFGSTQLIYDQTACLATYQIDIQNVYNESSYHFYLDGPFYSPVPTNNTNRSSRLGAFLGFNYADYSLSKVYSSRNIVLTNGLLDGNNSKYTFDLLNSTIRIYQYAGPGEFGASSVIYQTLSITFPISDTPLTQLAVYNAVNAVLSADTRFVNAGVSYAQINNTDVSGNAIDSNGNYRFEWKFKLNRMLGNNIPGSKIFLQLPQENNEFPIWVGPKSCFYFDNYGNEFNTLVSETYVPSSNFVISGNVYYSLTLTDSNYNVGGVNNVSYSVVNSNNYSLNNYLAAINVGFSAINRDISNNNSNGGNPLFVPGFNSFFIDTDSKIHVKIDMSRYFYTENFVIDVSNTFLNNLGISSSLLNVGMGLDVSMNRKISGSFSQVGSYTVSADGGGNLLMKVYGSTRNTNGISSIWSDLSYNVYINPGTYNYRELETEINRAFRSYIEPKRPNSKPLQYMSVAITTSNVVNFLTCNLSIDIQKVILQDEYILSFYDTLRSWDTYLYLNSSYRLSDYSSIDNNYAEITGNAILNKDTITLDGSGAMFHLTPIDVSSGVLYFPIPPGVYTRTALFNVMNNLFMSKPETVGTQISTIVIGGLEYTRIRWNINKVYTTLDYQLVFYDLFSFVSCFLGNSSVRNATWDTTLGWITGFRALTQFPFGISNIYTDINSGKTYYKLGDTITKCPYIITSSSYRNIVSLTGDTTVSVNLYNYFMVILDDYNQNHLNDGLITITPKDNNLELPSYANRYSSICDPLVPGNTLNIGITKPASNSLTQKQIYSLNQIIQTQNTTKGYTNSGVFVKDIFGLIPIKTAGMKPGDTYVEFGGTLQNQDRIYFGPVNIHRMGIKLMNDRGDIVDLNGANWSLQFMCEQLYQTALSTGTGDQK